MKRTDIRGNGRNYQVDVLKLLLSVCVFLYHTRVFMPKGGQFYLPVQMGWTAVHFFFVISGFLMVKSIGGRNYGKENAERYALEFVLNKFKGLFFYILNAEVFSIIVRIIIFRKDGAVNSLYMVFRTIPELLGLREAVGRIGFNITWYISAMLLAMLPLGYMMIKNKDFFLCIFAPLASLFLYGYIYSNGEFVSTNEWYGLCYATVVRAMCGLCFGAVAWLIYTRITSMRETRLCRLFWTAAELICYFVVIFAFFCRRPKADNETLFSVLLLVPLIIAIAFSGKSNISRLFTSERLRPLNTISLLIYLDHIPARHIVSRLLPGGMSYWSKTLCAALFTALFCFLNHLMTKLEKNMTVKVSAEKSRESV